MKQVIRQVIKETNNVTDEPFIYTLLLDMNSIMKACLVNKKVNNKGLEIGMVYHTLLQIRNMLAKKDFNFCYAMYDGDGSGSLRYQIYKDYKANRDKHYEQYVNVSEYDKKINEYCKKVINYHKGIKPEVKRDETDDEIFARQREIVFKCLEELFVRQCIYNNVEGDDLIAYYVKNKKPNERIVIISGDRDLTQLISDSVTVYVFQLKKFITPDNHIKEIGFTHENVLIKKIICGDASDNIKGIKGVGETTFFKLFPNAIKEKLNLDDVIRISKDLLEERTKEKKKPLKSLENIVNKVTDGIQGKNIYEINKQLIDLSQPLLTDEAKEELDNLFYAPLDPEGRDYKNLYEIIRENDIQDLLDSDKFSNFFTPFGRLIENEKKYKG